MTTEDGLSFFACDSWLSLHCSLAKLQRVLWTWNVDISCINLLFCHQSSPNDVYWFRQYA